MVACQSPYAAYLAALPPPPALHPLSEEWPKDLQRCSPVVARLYEDAQLCHARVLGQSATPALRQSLASLVTRNFHLRLEVPLHGSSML